jgi:hypothetical protein
MNERLPCGITWAELALTVAAARDAALCGLFPGAGRLEPDPPGSPRHAALAAALARLLAGGEGALEGRKVAGLAIELMHEYQALLGLPPADPVAEVLIPWEAGVRHAAAFLAAEPEDVEDLTNAAGQWRDWAVRALPPALPAAT